MAEPPSSPPSADASVEDALAWYKSQYEQLELELSEFQTSSKELEAELERDLNAADKRERSLREKAESLDFEVEEWKRKYKDSKAEANAAQNTLEKEITTLRDANRTLQLKLRDIEVANDDFERQARNTTSSLEDLESKYNMAIERAVMMEEEIKIGEQEREQLRVEAQRLREELSDLRVEAEILQDKMKKQENRHLSAISTDLSIPDTPTFAASPNSTASSPLITTPPDTKSMSTVATVSELQDPPSPPMSDASAHRPKAAAAAKTPALTTRRSRLPSADNSVTPKPRTFNSSVSSARGPGSRIATTGSVTRTPAPRPTAAPAAKGTRATSHRIPASNSLAHVRSLTAQMQRLEARVHSARSKLPAPITTPPRASPRSSIAIPSSVTVRSRKRTGGSAASSVASSSAGGAKEEAAPANFRSSTTGAGTTKHVPRLNNSGVSRLSFGPLPNRHPGGGAIDLEGSRPSSRASISSYARPASRADSHAGSMIPPPRPASRTGLSGTRTPRPRSSLNGSLHGHNASMRYSTAEVDEEGGDEDLRTPSRRSTYSRLELEAGTSGLPVPGSAIPVPAGARRSLGGGAGASRRASSAMASKPDLGETY